MNKVHRFSVTLGNSDIVIEAGKLAGQAGGAVTVRSGDTMILATATMAEKPREAASFFPLTVDYEERLYAAGKIPGGFFKREGRPTESAILLCRLVDRAMRPLFPKDLRNDVQIVLTALSADHEHYLDILSIIGASAALMISDIPWGGPVGAIRVGYANGQLLFNPTDSEMQASSLDLRLAGTANAPLMVEAGADGLPEDIMLDALQQGFEAFQGVIAVQNEMRQAIGKEKASYPSFALAPEVKQALREQVGGQLAAVLESTKMKEERALALDNLRAEAIAALGETYAESDIDNAFDDYLRDVVRAQILDRGVRPDGRDPKTIRPISCEVGLLPRTHGSGLFTRGETQVLSIVTLGTASDEQILDGLGTEQTKRYIHHYNFPPYSTGETGRIGSPRRREIGHGALAERALLPVIPSAADFPYTLRVVSEVMSSNGSTSMASVCGSSLALMDAGVPIKAPVAGAAMGMVKEGDRVVVLTDIQGMEDHLGDMDFKVTGTAEGITALQMDLKVKGISHDILRAALTQAKEARLSILDKMLAVIDKPRAELSKYAPRITTIKINTEKIGAVIGPGGKTIRSIVAETGAKIDVEEDGTVYVASVDGAGAEKAIHMIRQLTEEAEVGKVYTGKVVSVTSFGAFVEILPGQDGLVHVSQLADHYVRNVEDEVQVGDEVSVMVIDIGGDGKIKLSRQAVLQGWTVEEAREQDRGSRGGGGGGGGSRPPRDRDRRPRERSHER